MKIIRFVDEKAIVRYGRPLDDGFTKAVLLKGDPYDGFKETRTKVAVHKLLAPVDPAAILCVGLNYRQHAVETHAPIPDEPVLFMKNPAALNHPGDPIIIPASCSHPPEVDYEVELAVVIKQTARDVKADEALAYVAGYTIGNDVSARTWQKRRSGGQWVRGKSFDTFCPLGPVLVTPDEIDDPQSLGLSCRLNGKPLQEANTSDMIFTVAQLIEHLSAGMTLVMGTVILTGTPSGVGVARSPQVFLKPGDRLELSIDRIGTLVCPVEGA
jgi:2-keto-4-pentenoate hydratase/2-oxohepta-3-ene-1,7-dioic acid hydratase in catechol pathway